jgi:hypothetical protein
MAKPFVRGQKGRHKMKSKTRIMLVSIITIAGALLAVCWAAAEPGGQAGDLWSLGGCWIETCAGMDGSIVFIYDTLTPIDSTGEVFAFRQSYVNADPTVEGLLPEADFGGELLGTAVRTDPNTYNYTLIGHVSKFREAQRPEILGMVVFSGKLTIMEPDTLEDTDVFAALYGPDADVSPVDGLPDEGAEPLICVGPMVGTGRRIGILPPCTPTPMPTPEP